MLVGKLVDCNGVVVVVLVWLLLVLEEFDCEGFVLFLLCYVVFDMLVGCEVCVELEG